MEVGSSETIACVDKLNMHRSLLEAAKLCWAVKPLGLFMEFGHLNHIINFKGNYS